MKCLLAGIACISKNANNVYIIADIADIFADIFANIADSCKYFRHC